MIEAELAEQGADLVELASETAEEADAKRARPRRPPAPSRADVGNPTEVAEDAPGPDLAARAQARGAGEGEAREGVGGAAPAVAGGGAGAPARPRHRLLDLVLGGAQAGPVAGPRDADPGLGA